MKKQFFFDDSRLFGRDNVRRVYGSLERIAEYNDGICSTDFCSGSVFRLDNGNYRMLYFGHGKQFMGKKLFSAISDDGIRFTPEPLELDTHRDYPHEVMSLPKGAEVACICEDKWGKDRYILLMSEFESAALTVHDVIYTSPDLLHWTKKENASWGDGTEPLASAFYNKHRACFTIMQRPFWGVRTVGYKTTEDWNQFSEFRHALGVDAEDEALSELYGMYAFAYDDTYIGIPHLYCDLHSEYNAKYKNGRILCQLAYSYDGEYWHRGLSTPFLTGGKEYPIVWLSGTVCREEDVLFYGTASTLEHGPAFREPGHGTLFVYRLRKDGFMALESEDKTKPSRVITREKIWHGGELHLNIHAENITVGVYETDESELVKGNALGIAHPVPGYSKEDCIPFSGDSTDHVPQYQNGKTLKDLVGKTLVFEINYEGGALYSLWGDYTDVFNTEGARYRRFGILPQGSSFRKD